MDDAYGYADSWLHSSAALTQHGEAVSKMEDMEAARQRMLDAFHAIAASPPGDDRQMQASNSI